MPIVQIEILEGRTVEQKRKMVEKVTEALVESINCSRDAVWVIIREMKKENFSTGGKLWMDK